MAESDLVAMDLRGFSAGNQGCLFELRSLIDIVPGARVVLLTDGTTDTPFLRGQLGVWLEKILRNCVYLLVENPAYTLVDIPLILDEDTSFRNYLLANVKANPYIKAFWFREFDRLTRREKTEQVGPALSRLDIFRGNATIRHIVGQGKQRLISMRY